jgi:transposase
MLPTLTNDSTLGQSILAVALELSARSWKVALSDGRRDKPSIHNVSNEDAAKRLAEAAGVIEACKVKWGLGADCRVVVMYEAGQDGFWISRALTELGYEALIADPASIPVERHARRAKTDRLDAIKLVNSLLGYLRGERDRMHVIRIPAASAEEQRHLARDRGELQKEIQQHRDRMRKLLRTVGNWEGVGTDFETRLKKGEVKCHDGKALSPELQQRFMRECERLALVEKQLVELEIALVAQLPAEIQAGIGHLQRLKGVGFVGAVRLVLELFWRNFNNRREVGACVGLVPQPYDSGQSRVDQGISKQGNRRVRALLIEMAWMWLRYQPGSAMSRWFAERTQGSGPNKRGKRIAIVAVARRLAISLWRYLETGVVPAGALMKAA